MTEAVPRIWILLPKPDLFHFKGAVISVALGKGKESAYL